MATTEISPNQSQTEAVTAHVLWMTVGLSCEGDSVAMTSATSPSLEDIITGAIPGMPKVVVHNQVLAYEYGADYVQAWFDAEQGKLDPFVLIIEGSLGNEKINGDGYWTGFGVNPSTGQPITTNEWVDRLPPQAPPRGGRRVGRPARAEGRRSGRRRDVRNVRRHPGDEEQPDRRDGRARLPRLELEVEGRHPDREHPRLSRPAGQHDRDADVPGLRAGRDGAAARPGRPGPPDLAVRAHRPRGLQPRRVLRGGRLRDRVRLRPPLPGEARLQGPGGQVQRADQGVAERHRRLPQRRRHLHGVHDAGLPRQVHAVHGPRPDGRHLVERRQVHLRA